MISPIESACILNNPLPSPLKIDAVTDPLTFTSAFIVSDEPEGVSIKFVSIIDADNGIPLTIFTEDGEAFITGLPLTKSDITLELTWFKPFGFFPMKLLIYLFFFYIMTILVLKQLHPLMLLLKILLINNP